MTLPVHGPTASSATGDAIGVHGLYEEYGKLIGHRYAIASTGAGTRSGFTNISLSEACATRFEGSAARFEMSPNQNGLDLIILSFPEPGQDLHYEQGGRDCRAEAGEAVLHTTDRALDARGGGPGAVMAVALPRAKLTPLVADKDQLSLRKLARTPALSLLRAHVRSFLELDTTPDAPLAALIADQLCDLAALALGPGAAGRDRAEAGSALTDARFDRAMRFIRHHLEQPGLSERDIARHLNLSTSSVRKMFAAKDTSPAKAIRNTRSDLAARLLSDTSRRDSKIVTIAFECGFQSLSAFYESFRDRHGMHPSDYRALVRAPRD